VTGLPAAEAHTLRKHYWQTYGTTLNGLQKFYDVDTEDYLAYTHGFDARELIRPNPMLNTMLARLPQRKLIFTNGTREHADNILQALDLVGVFDVILGLRDFGFRPKPEPQPYQTLLQHLPHPPQESIFIEDSLKNLPPAKQMGIATVWLTTETSASNGSCDHVIQDILEVEKLL
jgi:putative hydrolase of the HAD superfamily